MIAVARARSPLMPLENIIMQDQQDVSTRRTPCGGEQEEQEKKVEEEISKTEITQRGYSDSVLACRLPIEKMHQPSLLGYSPSVSASPSCAGDNDSDDSNTNADKVTMRRLINDPDTSLQSVKTRHVLRLPSFQLLGLCGPLPGSLPTPPDEITHSDFPISAVLARGERMSFPEGTSLPTPDLVDVSVDSFSEPPSSTTTTIATRPETSSTVEQDASGPTGPSVVTAQAAELQTEISSFLLTPINIATSNLPTESPSSYHAINIMSHSQPCPLPQEDGAQTTALEPLVGRLRSVLGPGTCLDVTIPIPLNFEPSRILASPIGTPITSASAGDADDYFSHNNNVFPRVVLAPDHEHAMTIAGPPSPRTVVPPSSIQVSLLERYIPPPSMPEYADLFGLEGPSVLVDRLFELSPRNGTLIFVYPTATGAAQFCERCLHPVIDPLLRTLISVHGLSNDFGPAITRMPAASDRGLGDFDRLKAKLLTLLSRLNRPPRDTTTASTSSRPANPTPTFTLAHSAAQQVALEPATWISWWLQQEKSRIRAVVDRYYQRGHRVPDERVLSPGTMAWLISNGLSERVRSGQGSAELSGARLEEQGIEVGVFVVMRSS